MTVKELREILESVSDDATVLVETEDYDPTDILRAEEYDVERFPSGWVRRWMFNGAGGTRVPALVLRT